MKPTERVQSVHFSEIRRMFEMVTADAINMGLGEPDFDTPPHIIKAAKNALNEGFTHYTINKGIIELREAISQKLEEENKMKVDPESIIITVGTCEALYNSIQTLVERNDEVIIPDPGFLHYDACVKLAEGTPIPVKLKEEDQFRMTVENVLDKMNNKTKAIILNSPSNPTGSVMKKEDIKGIADLANDHDLYIISDEIYEKIIYKKPHYSPGRYCENTVTLNGFSKTYSMTGFRIGYAVAGITISEELLKVHQYNTACASSISQKAALAALEGPQDCVVDMVNEFKRRQKLVLARLDDMGITCQKPMGAFYAFPKIANSRKFVDEALKNRVLLVPGGAFGDYGEDFVRFSYATSYEQIEEAMDRLESISTS